MRVEVERETPTQTVNIFVIDDRFDGGILVWTPLSPSPDDWTQVAPGAQAPVSLRLPEVVWVAMVAAGADVPMPSRAQHDHLADAIDVRDRLLTLVEAGYLSAVPSGSFFGSRD